MKARKHFFMIIPFMLVLVFAPAHAATYGLVIGINDYPHTQNLRGAVDDARDIAEGLTVLGATQITMLLDREATREAIINAWSNTLAQATTGDTIIFSYAGHGGQEKEKVPGSEADHKDESLLLSGFDPDSKAGRRQRILDNEINAWFKQANQKGVKVIFVADACHSGGATRSLDDRVMVGFRSGPPYDVDDDEELSPEAVSGASLAPAQLPNVLFLAATQERLRSPEVLINGRYRGALSRAFGQALRGAADANGDGITSRAELKTHIDHNVRIWSEARQHPEFVPLARMDEKLFAHQKVSRLNNTPRNLPRVSLAILNMASGAAKKLAQSLSGVDFAGPGMVADLVWDARDHTIISSNGDQIAKNISRNSLEPVTEKWRILLLLKQMSERAPLAMSMLPDDGRHKEGQKIAFHSAPLKFPHMTVFNLASIGVVQFLYPRPDETVSSRKERSFDLPLKVEPPFGADHLVLIASQQPLGELHQRLSRAHIDDVAGLIVKALSGKQYQIGIQPLFTIEGNKK